MKFKKVKVSFLAICMLFSVVAYAGRISLGFDLKGGLNLAKLYGGEVIEWEDFGDKTKFMLGMIVDLDFRLSIGDYFTLQPEILFSQKGVETVWDAETSFQGFDRRRELGYFEIPILLKLSIPAGRVSPSFYLGPALDILLYAKTVYKDEVINKKKDYKNIDFGVTIGGELDIIAGPGRVIIGSRYTRGLNYMDKDGSFYEENGLMNSVISILVGYGINISGK